MCVCVYVCICVGVYVCICVCVCVFVLMFLFVCSSMCVEDRGSERERNGEGVCVRRFCTR